MAKNQPTIHPKMLTLQTQNQQKSDMMTYPTVDPFGSEGIEITLTIDNQQVVGAQPRTGFVNTLGLFDESINRQCAVFNHTSQRITTPMVSHNGQWQAITDQEAIALIVQATQQAKPEQNAVFVGPEQTNEAMYMLQKWARAALHTNAIGSFAYLRTNPMVNLNKNDNVPMHELLGAHHICIVQADLPNEHPITHRLVQLVRKQTGAQVTFLGPNNNKWPQIADSLLEIHDSHAFFLALNHHLVSQNLAHGLFTSTQSVGYEEYSKHLLKYNYADLLQKARVGAKLVEAFAQIFLSVPETVVILSEKSSDETTFAEVKNLMLLTERQAKPSAGMMYLKSARNSQGLFDMGIMPGYGPGFRKIEGDYAHLLQEAWQLDSINNNPVDLHKLLSNNELRNIFVFDEDPFTHYPEYAPSLQRAPFLCVQSTFHNATTAHAHLVLPMNFGIETGGSYTSSFKTVQNFKALNYSNLPWNDYKFFAQLHAAYGLPALQNPNDIFLETAQFFETSCCGGAIRHRFERS